MDGFTPLTSWTCDTCQDTITDPELSLVVWRSDDQGQRYDFRIVHKSIDGRRCDPEAVAGFHESLEVSNFLGQDGLAMLLSWLGAGPIMDNPGRNRVKDLDEFVHLIRRVQTPWYEQARQNFEHEETLHLFGGANEYAPYMPHNLRRIAVVGKGSRSR